MSEIRLPEPALTAGLLMEGAQSQQQLAAAALEALRQHTAGLDLLVRDEVHRTLVETLADLSSEVARVTRSLETTGRTAHWRATGLGLAMAVVGIAAPVCARWWLPSPGRIAALEVQEAQLQATIARLRHDGGGVQLLTCGAAQRLCVRIDAKAPRFGTDGDVVVLADH